MIIRAFLVLLLAMPFSTPLWATPSTSVDALLDAIDSPLEPTPLAFRPELLAIAENPNESSWRRVRALGYLTAFRDAETEALFKRLATAPLSSLSLEAQEASPSSDPEVRRQALYSLGRSFATPERADLPAFIESRILNDPNQDVQKYGLLSLRWVEHPSVEKVLERFEKMPKWAKQVRVLSQKRALRLESLKRLDQE